MTPLANLALVFAAFAATYPIARWWTDRDARREAVWVQRDLAALGRSTQRAKEAHSG